MTNPNQAVRMLIVYAIVIPLAILMGYLLTNPLDYRTLGFIGIIMALIISPIFIKWHYPLLVFGFSLPVNLFFLMGNPPFWQIMVMISLGIAIVERAINSEKRFLKATPMTWAMIYTTVMAIVTMKLTGGFHLHTVGGETGGGRKYISLYLGIATFFALISRGIPPEKRMLYVGLFFLSGAFGFISDMFPYLPGPLKYINLIFPPSGYVINTFNSGFFARLAGVSNTATAIMLFMLARYGLRGILAPRHLLRGALFFLLFLASMLGGFRTMLFNNTMVLVFIFFLEGLHRTRWMFFSLLFGLLTVIPLVTMPRSFPDSIQRSISFLPVDIDPIVRSAAEGSTEWRLRIWEAMLPQVPDYLMLGKGYSINTTDLESMGYDNPFARSAKVDASMEALALSNDFHNGPLSTIICFGLWGCLSILAIMAAGVFIMVRNFKYGDADLLTVNTMLLAYFLVHVLDYFFIFGGFDIDVGWFARVVGFSVALNWGVCKAKARVAPVQMVNQTKATPQAMPQPSRV